MYHTTSNVLLTLKANFDKLDLSKIHLQTQTVLNFDFLQKFLLCNFSSEWVPIFPAIGCILSFCQYELVWDQEGKRLALGNSEGLHRA